MVTLGRWLPAEAAGACGYSSGAVHNLHFRPDGVTIICSKAGPPSKHCCGPQKLSPASSSASSPLDLITNLSVSLLENSVGLPH
jgi:hypothetical protein